MADVLSKLPESLIIAIMIVVAVTALLIPLVLRLAGLTSSQIVDVLTMTTKFILEIISEFRSENKNNS